MVMITQKIVQCLSWWTKAQPHHHGESARRKCRGVHPAFEDGEILMSMVALSFQVPMLGPVVSIYGNHFAPADQHALLRVQILNIVHVMLPTLTPNMN